MSLDFRKIYLPYCLLKHASGGYIVLNRNYKPIGFSTNEYLIYEDYPIEVKFLRLSKATAVKLSWNKSENLNKIFLYHDGTIPTVSPENMKNYLKRLEILAKLQMKDIRKNHFVNEKTGVKYDAYNLEWSQRNRNIDG